MPGYFTGPFYTNDLETYLTPTFFVDDYGMIDQYAATGSLWVWGGNPNGQLGDNTTTNASSPIQTVAAGTNWKQVEVGLRHTAAIKTDGTLWLWGHNGSNSPALGDNTITHRSSPVQTVAGGTNWKQVSCGQLHTAAIKTDGTLWLWGGNDSGALGNLSIAARSSPIQTVSAGTDWKLVSCGVYFTGAIKTDGSLWTWGNNSTGQLGDNTSVSKSSPIQTVSAGTNWKLVSCGEAHIAAIKTDGTLWTWGNGTNGRLGDNTSVGKSSPIQTVSAGTNWKQVSSTHNSTAAIKTDGTLWLWGNNIYGSLGDNTAVAKSSPVQTVSGGTNWKQVSCSRQTAAIKTDGTLWVWGSNLNGQLGVNDIVHRSSPVQTVAGGTNWKQVSATKGLNHTAAIYFYDAGNLYPSA